jgi:hypothetical protein
LNLLTAIALEPFLPGPQILLALASQRRKAAAAGLGNYVVEVPEVPAAGQGLLMLGFLVAGIAGLVWYSQRTTGRLRRNPTPYVEAWEAFLEAERKGASPAELRRLRQAVDEARRKSRERWKDDETETTVYGDDR